MKIVGKKVFGPGDFSVGLTNEFLAVLGKKGFSPEMMQRVADVKSGKADKIMEVFKEDVIEILVDWQNFYKDVFGIEINLSEVTIPKRKKGFNRLIVVIPGLTPQELYDKCKKLFFCWKWADKDLNEVMDPEKSERRAEKEPYAIWVRDRVEADRELKNLSAIQIQEKKITTETLEERFLHELKFFKETGKHLDVENITLCSGSRDSDGRVPHVHWSSYDGRLNVHCCSPGYAYSYLRAREVVS